VRFHFGTPGTSLPSGALSQGGPGTIPASQLGKAAGGFARLPAQRDHEPNDGASGAAPY